MNLMKNELGAGDGERRRMEAPAGSTPAGAVIKV